jgi:hypothetical protein
LLSLSRRNGAAAKKQSFMIVLHQFSWLQFGIAAIILAVCWYAAVALLFFRKDIQALFKGKVKPVDGEALRRSWDDGEEIWDEELQSADELMGGQLEEEGVSRLSFSSFGFAPREETKTVMYAAPENEEVQAYMGQEPIADTATGKNEEATPGEDLIQGDMADLLEEVKEVFSYYARYAPDDKKGFMEKIYLQVRNYPRIVKSSLLEPLFRDVAIQASEELAFQLSGKELQDYYEHSAAHFRVTFGRKLSEAKFNVPSPYTNPSTNQ